jgi:DNA invertase Pin-like site-specific DNA recombinase
MALVFRWARFSPQPNAEEQETVEHQLADGLDWIAERGHTDGGWAYIKEYSGGNDDNEALNLLVDQLPRGSILWARSWDRFYRNNHAMDGLALAVAKRRAALWSGREGKYEAKDPWRKFTTKLAWLMAELRLDEIRSNTSKGLLRRQAKGDRVSRYPPYGYRWDETGPRNEKSGVPTRRIADENEQANIMRILEIRTTHPEYSLGEIGDTLIAEGRWPRKGVGHKWRRATIGDILRDALARSSV